MRPETLELLSWISRETRRYPEAIDVWRTNCPQHSVWEDALGDGLVEVVREGATSEVKLTPKGAAALAVLVRAAPSPSRRGPSRRAKERELDPARLTETQGSGFSLTSSSGWKGFVWNSDSTSHRGQAEA